MAFQIASYRIEDTVKENTTNGGQRVVSTLGDCWIIFLQSKNEREFNSLFLRKNTNSLTRYSC